MALKVWPAKGLEASEGLTGKCLKMRDKPQMPIPDLIPEVPYQAFGPIIGQHHSFLW